MKLEVQSWGFSGSKKAKTVVAAIILSLILGSFPVGSQAEAKTSKATELTFTFSSEENPWSEKESNTLNKEIKDFYPLAKKVFGAPAVSASVNIRKNTESGPFFWQNGSVYEIVLPGTGRPDQLLHEMLHSFHGPYIMDNNAFEEGMVRAAEVEIMNRLSKYDYDNLNHSYLLDVYYEANNDSTISAEKGKFYSGFVNPLLRYQQAGYAWGKCLIEDKNFLVAFNKKYYAQAERDKSVMSDSKALEKIAGKIKRKVEGQSFDEWFSDQAIFDFSRSEGYRIFFKRDSDNIYIFQRYSDGGEKMLSDVSFSWKTYDYSGKLLGQGNGKTNSNGWDWLNIDLALAQPTSVRVEVEAVLPGGDILKKNFVSQIGLKPEGIFGVVSKQNSGIVVVKGKRAHFEAPVVNGTFAIPETKDLAGTFKITYVGANGNMSKTITKDASGYYVALGE